MTAAQDRRSNVIWLERGALCLLVAYLCLHTMPRAWSKLITDFPNYYLTARLAHEGYDTSRVYEWTWLEREKDHHAIDVRVIGLVPITPFSTLVMWPAVGLSALTAKHIWLLVNLALLVPLCWMLRSMTGLTYQRTALVFALSVPLQRNLLYGQLYLLLLILIVAACWAYLHELHYLAGALIAIAAACKLFPVLFFLFFLQRRDWRALLSGALTGLAVITLSIAVFGWNLHRTYLHEVLPWTLRGEGLPPYETASASISSILHHLFLSEPQWNPHPWHSSVLCYALLQPTLQMLALAPAILLIRRNDRTSGQIMLEWSALLVSTLAISTSPASYNFILLAFPVSVLAARLIERRQYGWLGFLLVVYLGIGFPMPSPNNISGPVILLYVPRLPLMFVLLFGCLCLLWRDQHLMGRPSWDWTHTARTVAMVAAVVVSVRFTLHQQNAMREEFAYRLPTQTGAFLKANPRAFGDDVSYIAFTQDGHHLVTETPGAASDDPAPEDDLSFATDHGHTWIERGFSPRSKIVELQQPSRIILNDAREPTVSLDGQSMAFVRDDYGRGRLMVRSAFQSDAATEHTLSSPALNVYEASFLSGKEYAYSAVEQGHAPQIYITDQKHLNSPIPLGEARYPALSPDGKWLAYSHFASGSWNLWIWNRTTGANKRIADLPCNQIQPAWEDDSKTLIYGSDCGRSLWFTALSRRLVIP